MSARRRWWLLLVLVVVVVLLIPAGGAVGWLIAHNAGWDTGVAIAAVTVGVAAGAGIAAVFGPPMFDRVLDRPPRQAATPAETARKDGTLGERRQDRLAMREALRGAKDELFSKRRA